MTETLKNAMRAVRRGWVNGEPAFRLFHLSLIGTLTAWCGLLIVYTPTWHGKTLQAAIFALGLGHELYHVSQMPGRSP